MVMLGKQNFTSGKNQGNPDSPGVLVTASRETTAAKKYGISLI
jgi:hypothetical protein